MARFLEIKKLIDDTEVSNLINVGTINYVFNYEEKAILKTTSAFIVTENSYQEVYALLRPFQFNQTELNGTTIHAPGINTNDIGVKALINLNRVALFYGSWQGEIDFEDGSTVESYFSPHASVSSLGLEQGNYILRKKNEE